MERVLIFGSTKEARDIAAVLRRRGKQIVFSVVSEYAKSLLPMGSICYVGRLDRDGMLALIRQTHAQRVVDATHPYAVQASRNIRWCCEQMRIPCDQARFDDLDSAWRNAVEWVDTRESLIAAIQREKGNLLLAVDGDVIHPIPREVEAERLFPRISPDPQAVAACLAAGYPMHNIIAMEAPFSQPLMRAIFDDRQITGVVTRDATDTVCLEEMVKPALERGYHVIMVKKK